jgi:ribosomal protein L11 methyltransferase
MSRAWPALDLRFHPVVPDLPTLQGIVTALLEDFDPTGIEEREGSWVVCFLTADSRDRAARALLGLTNNLIAMAPTEIDDRDWASRSQATLGPVRVGSLIITPPWQAPTLQPAPSITVIRIQPSMGFGTGHHATTRLCLRALLATTVRGESVLDLGTGSGVLAIAAALLGASTVTAVDQDPDAIASARENLGLNGVTDRVRLHQADFRLASSLRADLVLANLTGGTLTRHAAEVARSVVPGGRLVLSGFTTAEEPGVLDAFVPPATLVTRETEGGWDAVVLRVPRCTGPSVVI